MHSVAWANFGRISVIVYVLAFAAVLGVRFWLKRRSRKREETQFYELSGLGEKVMVGLGGPRAAREFSESSSSK